MCPILILYVFWLGIVSMLGDVLLCYDNDSKSFEKVIRVGKGAEWPDRCE